MISPPAELGLGGFATMDLREGNEDMRIECGVPIRYSSKQDASLSAVISCPE
jgi:hypothetical protein